MAEYRQINLGKLRLKGEKKYQISDRAGAAIASSVLVDFGLITKDKMQNVIDKSQKKHKSKKRKHDDDSGGGNSRDEENLRYGGWWKASSISEITGAVAIQFGHKPIYIRALNQGLFTIGAPHDEGDGPDPEEILTALPVGNDHIALKSGYGKYLSVDSKGRVTGMADAIGSREQWQPVFQDGQSALLGPNDCFLGIDDEDNVIAKSPKATAEEMITIRCIHEKNKEESDATVELDKGKLKEVELSYVKMFQKFQDKKTKMNPDGRAELKDARDQGKLHETLLDRRSKMKADRYCK